MKRTATESLCTGPESVCPAIKSLCTGLKSICTGAKSGCTDLKLLDTAPVSVLPPIVLAPTAVSIAAGWLNQQWGGMRSEYAHNLFGQDSASFNQRE